MTQHIETDPPDLIDSGSWKDGCEWKVLSATELPDTALCTAVGCVAITDLEQDMVVLTRNNRGWEMLAGHIDPGEDALTALARESYEEGGVVIVKPTLFAVRQIHSPEPIAMPDQLGFYPHPTSYMPYFYAHCSADRATPTGTEIVDSGVFSLPEIAAKADRGEVSHTEYRIIARGLQAARDAERER